MKQSYTNFLDFLKKYNIYNKNILEYIKENSQVIDYRDEEKRNSIGCYYELHNGILKQIHTCNPYIYDEITALINVHQYVHVYSAYKYLGKFFKITDTIETLPILYEQLYVLEHPTKELVNFQNFLNSTIKEDSPLKYRMALEAQKELLDYYNDKNPNYKALQSKAHKLTKKYTHNKNINKITSC